MPDHFNGTTGLDEMYGAHGAIPDQMSQIVYENPLRAPPTRGDEDLTDALPKGDFRFVALDVETSCGDSASICQIGLACVGVDDSIQTWSAFIDPLMPFASFNVQLHGISAKTVENSATFTQIWPKLQVLLSMHPMVQHSRFDERAINAACKEHGLFQPQLSWSNSVTIARTAWPELKGNGGHGLANLRQHLSLEFQHHDAGEDARAAALVVLRAEAALNRSFDQLTSSNRVFQLSFPF